jgi:hypothetical protein
MRYAFSLILISFVSQVSGQWNLWKSEPISQKEFSACHVAQPALINLPGDNDTLALDDMKFKILGNFKGLDDFMLLRVIPFGRYYLANEAKGVFEELIAMPIFSQSMKAFVCQGNIAGRPNISFYRIKDNTIDKEFGVELRETINEVDCVNDSSFCVKDINSKYWEYRRSRVKL